MYACREETNAVRFAKSKICADLSNLEQYVVRLFPGKI